MINSPPRLSGSRREARRGGRPLDVALGLRANLIPTFISHHLGPGRAGSRDARAPARVRNRLSCLFGAGRGRAASPSPLGPDHRPSGPSGQIGRAGPSDEVSARAGHAREPPTAVSARASGSPFCADGRGYTSRDPQSRAPPAAGANLSLARPPYRLRLAFLKHAGPTASHLHNPHRRKSTPS